MNKPFNKLATLEFEKNICKYRIELSKIPHVETEKEIEEEIKRGIFNLGDIGDYFVTPMSVNFLNHFLVIYYNLSNHYSFNYLKEVSINEKIKYLSTLVEIFKGYEKHPFVLERLNFTVDPYEEKVKVIFFETENLKIYSNKENEVEFLKNLIISTFTLQDNILVKPKRADFLDPSTFNIKFVEELLLLDTLEDIEFFIEKKALETNILTDEIEVAATPEKKKKKGKEKKVVTKPVQHYQKKSKQAENKKFDTKTLLLLSAAAIVFIGYLYMTFFMGGNGAKQADLGANKDLSETFLTNTTENTLLKAYQAVYNKEIEVAYDTLKTLNDVTIDDVSLLIDVYVKNNKASELLDKYPNIANEFISYLISNDKLDYIADLTNSMQTQNPYIEFEKSFITGNYENVVELSNNIKLNARKESQIVSAYLALGQKKEALDFAKKTNNPDLIKQASDNIN